MNTTIIASEGGAGHYPENTAYAVARSLADGVDGCELDFHLTADGQFVAHHNYRLKPALTRDAAGNWLTEPGPLIRSSSLATLQQFNFGGVRPDSRTARDYPLRASTDHEPIATLAAVEEAFTMSSAQHQELWFEAKTDPNNLIESTPAPKYAQALVQQLATNPLLERTVLIAFDWQLLQLLRVALPELQTGFLTIDPGWFGRDSKGAPTMPEANQARWFGEFHPRDFGGSVPRAVKAAGGTYWSPYCRDISAEDVQHAHDIGIKVSTWGADTEEEIARALATGVDSLTTAYPERAYQLLSRPG